MYCTGLAMTISFYGSTGLVSWSAPAASLQSKQFPYAACGDYCTFAKHTNTTIA